MMISKYISLLQENDHFPAVILIEPSKPQNLGSIARVMLNFGYSKMILVNPKVALSDPEIFIVARKAKIIIDQASIYYSFSEIRKDFSHLIGTTARVGSDYNLARVAIDLDLFSLSDLPSGKTALVFGREQYGLTNEEISQCDFILTIPTDKIHPVLNLSHATAIVLYMVQHLLQQGTKGVIESKPKHRPATHKERQLLLTYFQKILHTVQYHPEKQHIACQAFDNIISRGYITGRELTILMGVFKWLVLNLDGNI